MDRACSEFDRAEQPECKSCVKDNQVDLGKAIQNGIGEKQVCIEVKACPSKKLSSSAAGDEPVNALCKFASSTTLHDRNHFTNTLLSFR